MDKGLVVYYSESQYEKGVRRDRGKNYRVERRLVRSPYGTPAWQVVGFSDFKWLAVWRADIHALDHEVRVIDQREEHQNGV